MGTMSRVVIVTAQPVERAAMLRHLTGIVEERHRSGTLYARGVCLGWDVLLAEVGAGNAAAAQETERAIAHLAPQLALMVGVAGGVKDVQLGDVVAASKVYDYEFGVDGDTFRPRPEVGLSSYPLVQQARAAARGREWLERILPAKTDHSIGTRAFVGPVVAGQKVVKSSQGAVSALIRQSFSDALAVEMEGAGFLRSAYANSVDALVVRGISDLLDGKERADASGSQETASAHASAFACDILARLLITGSGIVANGGIASNDSTDESDDLWVRLRELAPRLYPRGPQHSTVWEDAGGDLACLDLSADGRTQWSRAIRLIQRGGGGDTITAETLVERMLQDYRRNYELDDIRALIARLALAPASPGAG